MSSLQLSDDNETHEHISGDKLNWMGFIFSFKYVSKEQLEDQAQFALQEIPNSFTEISVFLRYVRYLSANYLWHLNSEISSIGGG